MDSNDPETAREGRRRGDHDVDVRDKVDKLSSLPNPILHCIFSFVPTIDVVRCSLLSRRWRYFWTSMPFLDIDHCYFWSPHIKFGNQLEFGVKFTNFVTSVLMFRDGSDIQRFRLSSFIYCSKWVDMWVTVLMSHNVKELDLTVCPEESMVLPQCLADSDHLETLKLNLFNHVLVMPRPMMGRFSKLSSLHLISVRFPDSNSARMLFLRCKLLEHLVLDRCIYENMRVLIIRAINLKTLTIDNVGMGNDDSTKTGLKIFAPNLLSLKVMGPKAWDYDLQDTASLTDVCVQLFIGFKTRREGGISCPMYKLFTGFHSTKFMKLHIDLLQFYLPKINAPDCFPAPFQNLEFVKLYTGADKRNLEFILHLLQHSPMLETLAIDFKECDRNNRWESEDKAVACLMYCLKTIEIGNFEGQENILELIRFLLRNGCLLEKMTITWSLNVEKPMEIIENGLAIMAFPKASSDVSITFL
ncbi:F-box/LRR-repeat protein [Tripterygium wilfordii]|uniref:F-box/LRR-repeat protein n=1 Tax=Tripterygium wilfordii TaxID=458696 RepID=A0A7J7CBX2_TRIWF|nr:probable FBD-associated F-box protein At1g32375 [Tripterygium wilfordii]KAF5731602.1 F-box/LRR-repeat protein [Tripterygium wilfordii]